MDDQRHAAALTGEAVGDEIAREIARALAVDPSPEFLARVRMQIANEPGPLSAIAALKGCATFSTWRRASALRSSWLVGGAVAAAVVLAIVLMRSDRPSAPAVSATLASRAIGETVVVPYVASGFSRTYTAPIVLSSLQSVGPAKAGPHEEVLLDPRETQALRSLLASVRTNRVDLSPLLTATAPAPTELPPASDLVIAPIAIEPIAPTAGAQGERQ